MQIGVPKEIKVHEYRVGLTPGSVRELTVHGHQVIIEKNAGIGIGCPDEAYLAAGAELAATAEEVFTRAELIIKVKEPQPAECRMLRPGHTLFTYLHLAPDPEQTRLLLASGATAIAYETVTAPGGGLPLLIPMSEVAGRMSIQAGAFCLEKAHGGAGLLLGGVPGVPPARVVILGGGTVGSNASRMAIGAGADVTVLDHSVDRLRQLDARFNNRIRTVYPTHDNIERHVLDADLVIGSALIPGATAPKLVTAAMVHAMRPGSVLIDVSIDQGGCFETSRPTTHASPTYLVAGIVHYCVANMPGAVARTSTFALNNATLPFILALADKGCRQALRDNPHLRSGLSVIDGKLTCAPVAEALGLSLTDPTAHLG